MKTIVENSTNLSKYLLADSETVTIEADKITVGNPAKFIIADLNSGNATLHTGVTNDPDDWAGNKYTFDGTTWTQDSNWVDPDADV